MFQGWYWDYDKDGQWPPPRDRLDANDHRRSPTKGAHARLDNGSSLRLDLQSLPKGLYFLRLGTEVHRLARQ